LQRLPWSLQFRACIERLAKCIDLATAAMKNWLSHIKSVEVGLVSGLGVAVHLWAALLRRLERWLPAQYYSGDHLHPNNAGYAAIAASVDLSPFRRSPSLR
jgi:lysophospholipase L1-like esterase